MQDVLPPLTLLLVVDLQQHPPAGPGQAQQVPQQPDRQHAELHPFHRPGLRDPQLLGQERSGETRESSSLLLQISHELFRLFYNSIIR